MFSTADAVGLDDLVRLMVGADGSRVGLECERIHVPHPGIAFIKVITDNVLVGEMAVGADGITRVSRVVPVLILRVHRVAVVAGGRFVPQVGRRIRHPRENAQGEE